VHPKAHAKHAEHAHQKHAAHKHAAKRAEAHEHAHAAHAHAHAKHHESLLETESPKHGRHHSHHGNAGHSHHRTGHHNIAQPHHPVHRAHREEEPRRHRARDRAPADDDDDHDDDRRARADAKLDEEEVTAKMDELPTWEQEELAKEPASERLADAKELEDDVDGSGPDPRWNMGAASRDDSVEEKRLATTHKMNLMDSILGSFEKAKEKQFITDDAGEKDGKATACFLSQCGHVITQCQMDESCSLLFACLAEEAGSFEDLQDKPKSSKAVQRALTHVSKKCEGESRAEHGELSFASHKMMECTTQKCGGA